MAEQISINGQVIQIKEFNGVRVVTFKDIDRVHERPEGTAKRNFNKNKEHFIEGEDFFKVCANEIRTHKIMEISPKAHEDIILITESGYLMLVKSFTDALAWEVQRQLVKCYFIVAESDIESETIKPLKYEPTRPLTTDDYLEASRTVAKCHNSRLPIVLDLLEKAGLDIKRLDTGTIDGIENDGVDLVDLLNQFTLQELLERLPICKTSIYYYRIGKVTPHPKRRKEIIAILGGA